MKSNTKKILEVAGILIIVSAVLPSLLGVVSHNTAFFFGGVLRFVQICNLFNWKT
jgi:hypothetical protein